MHTKVFFTGCRAFCRSPNYQRPKKIREIKVMLKEAGFLSRPGKGSYSNWKHPQLPQVITVARKDGDDAPRYLERKVLKALKQLENLSNDSD